MRIILLTGCVALLLLARDHLAQASSFAVPGLGIEKGWRWETPRYFDLPGARLSQQSFHASQAPAQAARWLVARPETPFDRLSIVHGHMMLSGLRDGTHWLAWLRTSTHGATQGLVSVLRPGAGIDRPSGIVLPEGLAPLTRISQRDGRATLTLSSHQHPGSAAVLGASTRQSLSRAGWHAAETLWPGGEAWQRRGASLHFRVRPQGGRSVLWTLHRDEEAP